MVGEGAPNVVNMVFHYQNVKSRFDYTLKNPYMRDRASSLAHAS